MFKVLTLLVITYIINVSVLSSVILRIIMWIFPIGVTYLAAKISIDIFHPIIWQNNLSRLWKEEFLWQDILDLLTKNLDVLGFLF